jgi:hypothetical protein
VVGFMHFSKAVGVLNILSFDLVLLSSFFSLLFSSGTVFSLIL